MNRKAFEYMISSASQNITEIFLNEYGSLGWELIQILPSNTEGWSQLIWKRELKENITSSTKEE